jgi:hypothetical protein
MISNDIISFEHIIHISQETTEEITAKNLKQFLITSLESHNHPKEFYDQLYYVYFPNKNLYEIYAYKIKTKQSILEYQIYEQIYTVNHITPNAYDLFIHENYFCVYKNGCFYFAKNNSEYSKKEIVDYLFYSYDIIIDATYMINQNTLEKLISTPYNYKMLKTILLKTKTSFMITYLFTLVFFFTFIIYSVFYENVVSDASIQIQKIQQLKKEYASFKKDVPIKLSETIIDIFQNAKQNHMILLSLQYDKKFYLHCWTKKKEDIFHFVKYYDQKVVIDKIYFNKSEKKYFLELYIEN